MSIQDRCAHYSALDSPFQVAAQPSPSSWPPAIARSFTTTLLQAAPHGNASRFLEVGTGSGRITRPLLERHVRLVGVDLCAAKLHRLAPHCQDPLHSLVQAEAACLPFPDASFDAIVTVHLLHLVANREEALHEFRRLLCPDGVYLRRGQEPHRDSPRARIHHRWQSLLMENHLPQRHGRRSSEAIDSTLRTVGAVCTQVKVACRQRVSTAGWEVDRVAHRTAAGTWTVPQHMLPRLLGILRAWAATEFGSLEQEFSYPDDLILDVWRFPEDRS